MIVVFSFNYNYSSSDIRMVTSNPARSYKLLNNQVVLYYCYVCCCTKNIFNKFEAKTGLYILAKATS